MDWITAIFIREKGAQAPVACDLTTVTEFMGLWSVMSSPFGGLRRPRSLGESQERVGKDIGSRLRTVDSTGQLKCPLFCRLYECKYTRFCDVAFCSPL